MTIQEMVEMDYPIPDLHKGFTIGKGKRVYWYVTPMPRSGRYRCLGLEEDNGRLGWPRYVYPDAKVSIVWRDDFKHRAYPGDGVSVLDETHHRANHSGEIVEVFEDGVSVNFYCDAYGDPNGAPSIEFWEWDEIEVLPQAPWADHQTEG